MKFDTYPISAALKKNLAEAGFKRPTDIQYKAIPSILKGEDVMAIAQTGTGKTAAFAIPVIEQALKQMRKPRTRGISCLVMVPTRELASQIGEVFERLCRQTRITPYALFGGVEQEAQIRKLARGVDILIATPGRMFDLISQGAVDIQGVKILVLDEADQMLDKGFIADIQAVKRRLKQRHQTLFFSATINRKIKKLAFSQVRSSAIRIQISPDDPVSKNVSHGVVFVKMDDKRFFLRRYVREHPGTRMMVFVRTRVRAERVCRALDRGGIAALTIHGEKDQKDRLAVMAAFKEKKADILIATDVSARGIDIPSVDVVVNYDLPDRAENYVHRVGRTGRGRSKGLAVSFCAQEEKALLSDIEEFLGRKIEVISMARDDYALTEILDGPENVQDLIQANEGWIKGKKKKGKSWKR